LRDDFKNERRPKAERLPVRHTVDPVEWDRLENVGDLHFHSSAFSVALDYYRQLLVDDILRGVPVDRAIAVLRKTVDSHLRLGQLDQAEMRLDQVDRLISRTTGLSDRQETEVLCASFGIRRAALYRERGRLHDSLKVAKRSFAVLALTDEHVEVARLQTIMGICEFRLGRLDKAEEFFTDGMATYRRVGHDLGVALLLSNLAVLDKNRCRWSSALGKTEKAIELAHTNGASHLLPGFYLNQGIVLLKINRLSESRTLLTKGLRLATSLGDRINETLLSLAMGRLETLSGKYARAEVHILSAKALADANGYQREATIVDEYLGDIQLLRQNPEDAQFNYKLGLKRSRAIASENDLEGELRRRLGEASLALGDYEEAIAASRAAIAICEKCDEDYEIGFCHLTMGAAHAKQGDGQQANHHFRRAIAKFNDQRLLHLWCRAILEFGDNCLASAGDGDLLLARRYLLDAQENGAAAVSDVMLCRTLECLARVQLRLQQFDDALLTVFDLERTAAGCQDDELDRSIVVMRREIDTGLLGDAGTMGAQMKAIAGLPGLFAGGGFAGTGNLTEVLEVAMARVQADTGFLAMAPDCQQEADFQISAKEGLTENLCGQLTTWFGGAADRGQADGTILFSRLEQDDELVRRVPAAMTVADSCVFMPVAVHGERFGLLFLGKSGLGAAAGTFDRGGLDFLSTYVGFLALFFYERQRSAPGQVAGTLIDRIENFENIITQNTKMLEVLGLARKVADSDLTVLLNGETGTGKGLLAYSIHALSSRASGRFVTINCAAIPEALLESELFGHKRGSFTGAHSDKTGILAEAQGGTVFLDEIGKMPISMQGKLLHFVDRRVIRPVGSSTEITVDVRVVCASKTDLHKLAQDGLFLEDLYYRLLDFPLVVPPLRERADDVELLTRHFIQRFSRELAVEIPALDRAFMDCLVQYEWPGNVRELEKALRRAMVLAQGESVLRCEHLPTNMVGRARDILLPDDIPPLKETLAGIEFREISRALRSSAGNKSQAARMLKISYPNLLKKIRHYGIVPE